MAMMLKQVPGGVLAQPRHSPTRLSAVNKTTRSRFLLSGNTSSGTKQLPRFNLPFTIFPSIQEAPADAADTSPLTALSNAIPARTKLILACTSSFMLSNMDKVNMTVAIIPMAQEMGWSSTVSGLVQSSFFWGFLLAQIPGGYLSSNMGGHKTLPPSVALWSFVTTLLPLAAASSMPALCATRSMVGIGEAVAPSAIVDMLARTIPKEQRAGAVSAAFSGLHLGSILGLLLSPTVIELWGWRGLFAAYGVLGAAWFLGFKAMLGGMAAQDPEVYRLLEAPRQQSATAVQGHIPYRAMVRSRPVQALMFTHMAHNWFNYTMLAWLPTYFTSTMAVDLTHAAHTALLPPLAGVLASAVAGRAADHLISSGHALSTVRKLAQCTAFLGPSALLALACTSDPTAPDPTLTVACITAALGMSSFSLAGLYCTHQDLSPKYASAMLGLTNTAASLPGVVGVAMVGMLLDQTGGSWELALFAPSAAMLLLGAVVYTLLGRNDPMDFDSAEHNDAPFLWEARLAPVGRMVDRLVSTVSSRVPR